jgi:branched-subunit amino acid transport protein
VNVLWVALIVSCAGSYLLKLAGLSLPRAVLEQPAVRRIAGFLPVAMLAALIAVSLFDGGRQYAVDWRALGGLAAGVVALLLRAGFLVVLVVAVVVTAVLRSIT